MIFYLLVAVKVFGLVVGLWFYNAYFSSGNTGHVFLARLGLAVSVALLIFEGVVAFTVAPFLAVSAIIAGCLFGVRLIWDVTRGYRRHRRIL